jgi:hypothetical protein
MTFSQPSHFCSFPLELSKSYKLHMWRLVVTQSEGALSFAYCRPKQTADFLNEDCTTRLDLKKKSGLLTLLPTDEFLVTVLAFMHEKLPFRDFNQLGENYARPEPRIKSKLLERPPELARGVVEVDATNGQIQVRPVSKFRDSIPESAVWFVPVESMQGRHSAMETVLQEMGLERTAPPALDANYKAKGTSARSPSSVAASTPDAPPAPMTTVKENESPGSRNPVKQPLKASELPPPSKSAKATVRGKDKNTGAGKRTSVFANDVTKPPDDSEVVKLKGAEADAVSSNNQESYLSKLWSVIWPGLWHAEVDVSGLPVPESERSRLPAAQSYSLSGWHPVWRDVSVGLGIRHRRDFESVSLKITLPGSSLFQLAKGSRKSTLVHGSLIQDFTIGGTMTRIEALAGVNFISTSWTYDRRASTFEIWSPSGRGTYIEPSITLMPAKNTDGFVGRVHYGLYNLPGARGSQWGIESSWQWAFEDEFWRWGPIRISNLLSSLGYQQGQLTKSESTANTDGSNNVALNSFWLGLRLRLDETD